MNSFFNHLVIAVCAVIFGLQHVNGLFEDQIGKFDWYVVNLCSLAQTTLRITIRSRRSRTTAEQPFQGRPSLSSAFLSSETLIYFSFQANNRVGGKKLISIFSFLSNTVQQQFSR